MAFQLQLFLLFIHFKMIFLSIFSVNINNGFFEKNTIMSLVDSEMSASGTSYI